MSAPSAMPADQGTVFYLREEHHPDNGTLLGF